MVFLIRCDVDNNTYICKDKEGNLFRYNLEDLLSKEVYQLNILNSNNNNGCPIVFPIIQEEWLCKGNAISKFVETEKEVELKNIKLKLLNKPTRTNYLVKKSNNRYGYDYFLNSISDLLNIGITKPQFLGVRTSDKLGYIISNGVLTDFNNKFIVIKFNSFLLTTDLKDNDIEIVTDNLEEGVYYNKDWLYAEKVVFEDDMYYKIDLFNIFNKSYVLSSKSLRYR